jgi:exopolyphosphatase/guanosine-5'-triphosphate,3'-diphosphate pyrophosphatase
MSRGHREAKTTPQADGVNVDELIAHSGIALPDDEHARRCARFAAKLAEQLGSWLEVESSDYRLAAVAALFHDAGYMRGLHDHHRKSFDIIREASLPGFSPEDHLIVASAARYHGRATPNIEHAGFGEMDFADQRRVRRISAIVRLSVALDASHLGPVTDIDVDFTEHVPLIRAFADGDAPVERDRLREAAGSVHHLIQKRIRTEVVPHFQQKQQETEG